MAAGIAGGRPPPAGLSLSASSLAATLSAQAAAAQAPRISARNATVGAVVPQGQELFRLIRKGRLEWRAEVPAAEMARLQAGMTVQVQAPGGALTGKLRMLAPTIDPQTRLGLAYVDLPAAAGLRAGSFARGEFQLGKSGALSLPASAVQLRDGFAYVYRVGADLKAQQTQVQLGRRSGERIEIANPIEFTNLLTQFLYSFIGILRNHSSTCDASGGEGNL